MKPMVQPGWASASTTQDSRKGGKLLRGRRTRARRCASIEQLESRCLLSTMTEFPALTSGFAADITSAAGKLWFTVQNPSAIGMLDPSDPTHPQFYSAGIGGKPVDLAQGPDGNIWFTEPTNHAIGMINTTNPNHPITIYNSANGLPAGAEPQGITSGIDPLPAKGNLVHRHDQQLARWGVIDPADPHTSPPRFRSQPPRSASTSTTSQRSCRTRLRATCGSPRSNWTSTATPPKRPSAVTTRKPIHGRSGR